MHARLRSLLPTLLLLAGGLLSACGGTEPDVAAPEEGAGNAPSLRFVDLEAGAQLESPAEICMEASGLTIEPSGEVIEGTGHHHLIIDPSAEELAAYTDGTMTEPVPNDETHIHMGDGSSCTTVELAPGSHTLLAVVADGLHNPLDPPLVATIDIEVVE